MSYAISPSGVELIAGFEGFVNGAYNDSQGYATAGYGHLLHRSPATPSDHREYDGRGRAFFLTLLHADIERVSMAAMRAKIHVPLNQHQVDTLACLCFNCGPGPLYGTIGRLLNARQYLAAANAFMAWSHPSVLLARRSAERRLFLTPVARLKPTPLPWLTTDERRWCLEYDRLKAASRDVARRRVLRSVMAGQAAKIQWAAKHEGGWDRANRRQRFHSLMARCS